MGSQESDRLEDMTDEEITKELYATRNVIRQWIVDERAGHADDKWRVLEAEKVAELVKDPHLDNDGYWLGFVYNYLRRCQLFGMDSPQGRQAMGKLIVTLDALLGSAIVAFGPMPKAGVPSGEIQ